MSDVSEDELDHDKASGSKRSRSCDKVDRLKKSTDEAEPLKKRSKSSVDGSKTKESVKPKSGNEEVKSKSDQSKSKDKALDGKSSGQSKPREIFFGSFPC